MKRMLFILSAVLALAITAPAGELYVLRDGKVEKVAEAKPAKCLVCGDDCKCKPGECPGKCPVEKVAAEAAPESGHWVQVCEGGVCKKIWVPSSSAKSEPVSESCASCASCGSASSGAVMSGGGFFRERKPVRRLLGAPFRLFFGGFGCCR